MIRALAITGPTASGKTALSIEVAKRLGGEIISLDSMQIYKKMDIGTAKATEEERAAVPHHMLDVILPSESFSAKAYRDMALPIARDIFERGRVPIFVGGTGLYLSTLLRPDCEEPPESDPEYRLKFSAEAESEDGRRAIWERLNSVDPVSAEAVHFNNVRRVIRALEIYETTGKPKSYFDELSRRENKEIGIDHVTIDFHDRSTLYQRVDRRVDLMMDSGLLPETKMLLDEGYLDPSYTAAQAIGYKEIIGAILGKTSLTEATEALKQASRNYAKRQLTWFRNMKGASVLFADSEDGVMKSADELAFECISLFDEQK